MKKQSTLLATLLLSLLFIISYGCKKDDTTTSPNSNTTNTTPSTATMSAKVNNVQWSAATTPTGTLLKYPAMNGKLLTFSGANSEIKLSLTFLDVITGNNITVGPCNIDHIGIQYSTVYPNGGIVTANTTKNEIITITKCNEANRTVSGTFSFISYLTGTTDTLYITNGVFNDINYTVLNK